MALRAPTTETVVSRQVAALSRVPSTPPKRVLRYELYLRRSEKGNAAEEKPGGGESRSEELFDEKSCGREKKGAAIEEEETKVQFRFFFQLQHGCGAAFRLSLCSRHDSLLSLKYHSKNETKKTKKKQVVCTLGPKSRSVEVLEELLRAGMSVARFNFSHGSHEYHQVRERFLNLASLTLGLVPVLWREGEREERENEREFRSAR